MTQGFYNAISSLEYIYDEQHAKITELEHDLSEAKKRVEELGKQLIEANCTATEYLTLKKKYDDLHDAIDHYSDYVIAESQKMAKKIKDLEKEVALKRSNGDFRAFRDTL